MRSGEPSRISLRKRWISLTLRARLKWLAGVIHIAQMLCVEMCIRDRNVGELFKQVMPEDLIRYGLIPEFVGRVPVVVTLDAVSYTHLDVYKRQPLDQPATVIHLISLFPLLQEILILSVWKT